MAKIIVIFAILFVFYCEINAELYHLQNKETATSDIQNPLETEKDSEDMERSLRRAGIQTQTIRYTNGSREDNSDLSEFGYFNTFFKPGVVNSRSFNKPGVVRRRFQKMDTVEENTETEELDSKSIQPKRRMKYHHDSKKNMTKKSDSSSFEEIEIHKKNKKDTTENEKSSGSTSSSEKLHTQNKRYKIKDREDQKKSKHPKDTRMNHEREKDKNKRVKEKNKGKKEKKKMDKVKEGIIKLSMARSSKNNKMNKTKQLIEKRSRTHNEPSKKNKSKDVLRPEKSNTEQSKTTIKVMKHEKEPTNTKSTKTNQKTTETMLKQKQEDRPLSPLPLIRAKRPYSETSRNNMRSSKLSALYLDDDKKKSNTRSIKQLRQESETTENLFWSFPPPKKLSPSAIIPQMNALKEKFPEVNITVTKSGRTVEYNDIVTVTFKEGPHNNASAYFRTHESKYIDDVPEKKIILIVHGLTVMGLRHISSLVYLQKLELLLSYYLKHLDKFEFIVMPLANPDGYSASLASGRAKWNKNMSPQDVCSGVFVDRNFDVAWNHSHNISPCSHLYPGATPFSEEESKAVRDVLHQYNNKIEAYIHVHAGTFDDKTFKGEAVLHPKGDILTEMDDDKYIDMKAEIDEMMKNASFRVRKVSVDSLADWYGVVQGTSVDYAASVYGIPYALEFVMQIYDNNDDSLTALKEIWSRVIDTTFNNMWKNLQRGPDARRRRKRS